MPDRHSAVVITAPQMQFEAGQAVECLPCRFPPLQDPGLFGFEDLRHFEGAVLILVGLANGESHTFGSAVLVEKGIGLAAGHVIREHQDQGDFDAENWAMYAFGPASSGTHCWIVSHISFSPEGDVAVLSLQYAAEMANPLKLFYWEVSARLPEVGEVVTAVGFRSAAAVGRADPEAGIDPCNGMFLASSGPVTDVWPAGRDRIMAPRPCFAATLTTVGAMSGGPVLNADGRVIGIVTASTDASGEAPAYTLCTLVWDGLFTPVGPTWPPHGWWSPELEALRDRLDVEDGWRLHWSVDGRQFRYQATGASPEPDLYAPFAPLDDPA